MSGPLDVHRRYAPPYHDPTAKGIGDNLSSYTDINDGEDNEAHRSSRPYFKSINRNEPWTRGRSHHRINPRFERSRSRHRTTPNPVSRNDGHIAQWQRPTNQRRMSYHGQPVALHDRNGFARMPERSRRGPRVPSEERASTSESISDVPYPIHHINYTPPPRMSGRPYSQTRRDMDAGNFRERSHRGPEHRPRHLRTLIPPGGGPDLSRRYLYMDEIPYEPMMTPAGRRPRKGMSDILDDIGETHVPRFAKFEDNKTAAMKSVEEEQQIDELAMLWETEGIGRVLREVRKGIRAEYNAASRDREAETIRNEKLAKLIQEKMEHNIDEVMVLLKGKVQQEFGAEKQTDTGTHANRDELQADIQIEMEEIAGRKAGKQNATAQPVQRSRPISRSSYSRHAPGSPAPSLNIPRNLPPSEDGEPLPQRPPDVLESPNVYAETENERETTAVFPSNRRRRLKRKKQQRVWERRERKTLRMIKEELGFPIAEMLAAEIARATYGYGPPMSPSFQEHRYPHPSRASSGRFKPTYRQYKSNLESPYSGTESADATYMARRYMQAQKRTARRGRPLQHDIQEAQHGVSNKENGGDTVLRESTENEMENTITKVKIIFKTAVGLIESNTSYFLVLLLYLYLFSYYGIYRFFT